MAKNVEELQAKLSDHLQVRFDELTKNQNKFDECYTRNQTNVSRYVDCIKSLIPKFKTAEETFATGMQFLALRTDECLRQGKPINDCLT